MYDTFKELGLVPEIMKAIEDMGFEEPTPIQKVSIPAAMEGKIRGPVILSMVRTDRYGQNSGIWYSDSGKD